MLRIYDLVLVLIRKLAPVIDQIASRDPDLSRQMRRSLSSVPLNIAEGAHSRGKLRGLRYSTAAGSMRECVACIDTAVALGYIGPVDGEVTAMVRQIIGTLMKCMP